MNPKKHPLHPEQKPEQGRDHPPATSASWGGRFDTGLDQIALQYSASVDVDQRLADVDITGSMAHAKMLARQGIVSQQDLQRIENGLHHVRERIEHDEVRWSPALEDVHMNIEHMLTEHIGEVGGKLHTARSRNDQVATDLRLWTREALARIRTALVDTLEVIAARAEQTVDILLPGYTHLQRGQPVRLAHHLLAWCEMLERDLGRIDDASKRLDACPLGAGALATTTFAIDRHLTAELLGFSQPTRNSMDTVADRDFVLESVSALAVCAVHLSRIAEELVLWSSQEFGFVSMDDAFATGSSMMPQKKNPDMAELMRGKTGRVVGSLVNLLVLMKGLPLTYNRDMQEDKQPTFEAFDTVEASLRVLAGMMHTVRFHPDAMRAALHEGFVNATEVADYLAARGLAFRQAHHVAGHLVKYAIDQRKTLQQLTLEEFRAHDERFDESIYEALDFETAVERRNVVGGPARAQVLSQIHAMKRRLQQHRAS
jgi:argininosuccinate lyase